MQIRFKYIAQEHSRRPSFLSKEEAITYWAKQSEAEATALLAAVTQAHRAQITAKINDVRAALSQGKVVFVGFVPLKNEAQGHMYREKGYDIKHDWHTARVHFYAVVENPITKTLDAITAYNAPTNPPTLTFPKPNSDDPIWLRDVSSLLDLDKIVLHQMTVTVCEDPELDRQTLLDTMDAFRESIAASPPPYANVKSDSGVGCQTLMRVLFERACPLFDLTPYIEKLGIDVTTFNNPFPEKAMPATPDKKPSGSDDADDLGIGDL